MEEKEEKKETDEKEQEDVIETKEKSDENEKTTQEDGPGGTPSVMKEFAIYSDDVDVAKKIEEDQQKKEESITDGKALTNGELLANELKKEAANMPQQIAKDQTVGRENNF